MINPIKDIIEYLRNMDPLDEFNRSVAEEKRQLARYKKLRRDLPKLLDELDATIAKIRRLID